ncbi:MAG: hypothetical protein ABH823_02575 [bacterium]
MNKVLKFVFCLIVVCWFMVVCSKVSAVEYSANPAKYFEVALYTEEYGLQFFPDYPPVIGQEITLALRTFRPAQKVTMYTDREEPIPLQYRDGRWWGQLKIPEDYQEGGHFFTVWVRYSFEQSDYEPSWLDRILLRKKKRGPTWSKSEVWYQASKSGDLPLKMYSISAEAYPFFGQEKEEPLPLVTGETISVMGTTTEAHPLVIKGNQTIAFNSRSLSGSREGYTPGSSQTREETLRINITGQAADTDIEASLFRSTALGVTQVGEREEEISIRLRRGSTEAYLGDFKADFNETEFTKLERELSGAKVRGDYGAWGFNSLYSSPKGQEKTLRTYGDDTQGPYSLGFAPVVVDSEQVYVDNVLQKRGDEYTIDYQAGTVTFRNKVIDTRSVISINFDYRQTLFQHATYGLRGYVKPADNLKIGATFLEDADSLTGAESIRDNLTSEAVNPQRHYVVGVDASLVSENLSADSEIAYSYRDLNLLSAASSKETSRAGKLSLSSSYGPFGLTGHAKKVGSNFRQIADPDPKQDIWEYGAGLSYRPNSLFGSRGNYEYQKYTQSGIIYDNLYKTAKAQLTPERLPSLEYNYSETDESNDPVTGSQIRRVITRNSAETAHRLGNVSTTLKGTLEKWLRRSPSEEVTNYRKVNIGVATIGLEKVSLATNYEIENREEPDGTEPFRRTYNLNLSATPNKQYFLSTSLNVVDDSVEGQTNVVDLAYKASPVDEFKSDGKYTITSLSEEFPTTAEAVAKHSASLSFDWRPWRSLRLRYLYKPNFTRIERTQTDSYRSDQTQTEVNILPNKTMLIGWLQKIGNGFTVYNNDYPNYLIKNNAQQTLSNLYTLKLAPLRILSTEFNYFQESSDSQTLAATQEPYVYTPGVGANTKFDALAKTSLTEQFSIDSRYIYQKLDVGTGEAAANVTNTKAHTASLKGIWNRDVNWTFSLTGAYTRTTDYNLSSITYTWAPGAGFIYRFTEKLRIDFDYTYSKSYAGAETEKNIYSLKTKYALSDFVDVTVRADREISVSPDYSLTDITGNVEISL